MKIGLSYSRCVRDIVEGRVDIDDVLVIIARTDCAASLGIDEAIRRAKAFIAEGADAIFVELKASPQALDDIKSGKSSEPSAKPGCQQQHSTHLQPLVTGGKTEQNPY